jgi:hypothetical protein
MSRSLPAASTWLIGDQGNYAFRVSGHQSTGLVDQLQRMFASGNLGE